jgi:hypothetical protein
MILIHGLLSVLRSSLAFWEVVEYSAAAVVLGGAIGEYISEFKKLPRDEHKREKLAKLSTIVLIAGTRSGACGVGAYITAIRTGDR